jgi:hypothetical protein
MFLNDFFATSAQLEEDVSRGIGSSLGISKRAE